MDSPYDAATPKLNRRRTMGDTQRVLAPPTTTSYTSPLTVQNLLDYLNGVAAKHRTLQIAVCVGPTEDIRAVQTINYDKETGFVVLEGNV